MKTSLKQAKKLPRVNSAYNSYYSLFKLSRFVFGCLEETDPSSIISLGFSQNITQHQICFVLSKTILRTNLAGYLPCYVFTLANTVFAGHYSGPHGEELHSGDLYVFKWKSIPTLTEIFFQLSGNLEQISRCKIKKTDRKRYSHESKLSAFMQIQFPWSR